MDISKNGEARFVTVEEYLTKHMKAQRKAKIPVVLIYDTETSGKRGLEMLSRIMKASNNVLAINPALWNCDHLSDPDWRAVAQEQAKSTKVLAICTDYPLTGNTRDWIQQCLQAKRNSHSAVVGMLGNGEVNSAILADAFFLQRETALAELEFFSPLKRPFSFTPTSPYIEDTAFHKHELTLR